MKLILSKVTLSSIWLRITLIVLVILLWLYVKKEYPHEFDDRYSEYSHYSGWHLQYNMRIIGLFLLLLFCSFIRSRWRLILFSLGIYGLLYIFIDWYITSYNALFLRGLGTGVPWVLGLGYASWEHGVAVILTMVLTLIFSLELYSAIVSFMKERKSGKNKLSHHD